LKNYIQNGCFSKCLAIFLGPATPIFFILSPGVNPLKEVEALGKKLGYTTTDKNFHNVSLGQGQEVVAEGAMNTAATEGHWVILQVCMKSIKVD
jgi:dynein heavy chain